MEIAAIILSTLCLIAIVPLWALFIAKNYMSETIIQYKSVDEVLGGVPPSAGRPMTEAFKEIGDPMDDDEKEYFEAQKQAAH